MQTLFCRLVLFLACFTTVERLAVRMQKCQILLARPNFKNGEMMKKLLSSIVILLSAAFFCASPSAAQIRLAVGQMMTANKNTSPDDAIRLENALRSTLAHAITQAAQDG